MTTKIADCRAQEPEYCWKHGTAIKPSSYLPSYDAEYQARQQAAAVIMSSSSTAERNAAEAQFEKQGLRLDASAAGYDKLVGELKASLRGNDPLATAHLQLRLDKADGLRAQLLAHEAIATFNPENVNALDRLFDGTGHRATVTPEGDILVQRSGFRAYALIKGADEKTRNENLIAHRREIAEQQRYVERYAVSTAAGDLPQGKGYSVRVESGVDYEQLHVRDAAGNALVQITLNPDHTFNSAKINSSYNDGSVTSLPSLMALRAHLFKLDQRNNGALPNWITGDPEPKRVPVAAATVPAGGDQLF